MFAGNGASCPAATSAVNRRWRRPAGGHGRRDGFALVAVIWGLGLVTLLASAVIVGARYRAIAGQSDSSVIAAEADAESAVDLAIAALLTPSQPLPRQCRLPSGARADIAIEEEAGKVDLNAASQATLERIFAALAQDKARGTLIAAEVLRVRQRFAAADGGANRTPDLNSTSKAKSGFTTILELDQVGGVSRSLLHAAIRHVTVNSGEANPVPEAANAVVIAALGIERAQAAPRRPVIPGAVTIRADIQARTGARFIREALVSFRSDGGQPYAIREWRRGDIEGSASQRLAANLKDCLPSLRTNPSN